MVFELDHFLLLVELKRFELAGRSEVEIRNPGFPADVNEHMLVSDIKLPEDNQHHCSSQRDESLDPLALTN